MGIFMKTGFRYIPNVVTLKLNKEACSGCGRCIEVCPHGVFELNSKIAKIIDRDACMECGACAKNCQDEAIFVKSGVGCASAVINGILTGKEASCGCSEDKSSSCSC
jgi:NAD-dependent dihydropyrimidine dehydrogenase PreA subunit